MGLIKLFKNKKNELQNEMSAENAFNLGDKYYLGIDCEKNLPLGVKYYSIAADKGLAMAERYMGYFYINGIVFEKNIDKSIEWYQRGMEHGDIESCWGLYDIYSKGQDVPENLEIAYKCLTKAAYIGDFDACYNAALWSYQGKGCIINIEDAFERMYFLDSNGYERATFWLAVKFLQKNEDFEKAFYYSKRSAEQGNADAMEMLGELYEEGKGCEKSNDNAFKWYKKAVEAGLESAMGNLSRCYFEGIGCIQNYEVGFDYLAKAIENTKNPEKAKNYKQLYSLYQKKYSLINKQQEE